ncbi:LamG-like jellyroll fold domain-containing protein [Tamlana sp. 2_MG-2023]|uniref:LamG-like jellyroll fold domain-containing protein n=1 Tax=unclassified Tamlana TaxID=2614803 RepID=UPI0026E1C47F|nr:MULTISPECIES: LamG-like jellyroll fold domain-containing protein [unclassified Tamlana]MDO6758919.1 LamG-like jellyroll fold domain-containing protein [Tamlana sp. 2_MG-2023]MDO6789618.1 LamG-like jellyroll fold domain-containing protein [Tamlana sp. 1_MG-2023]
MNKTTFYQRLLLPLFVFFFTAYSFSQNSSGIYDSDGDGIYDNVDIDDDNDGIPDTVEENACSLASGSNITEFIFLNETFGTGTGRGQIGVNSPYVATTGYCYEDGVKTSPSGCSGNNTSVNDGEYTLTSHITKGVAGEPVGPNDEVATWAWNAWEPIEDHTFGDTNGRMALFNAENAPGNVFYRTELNGLIASVPITYSFAAINVDKTTGTRSQPEITVNFYESNGSTLIASENTGKIFRCSHFTDTNQDDSSCSISEWQEYTFSLTTGQTTIIVEFVNTAPGGLGNDLALDDIIVKQSLCDSDGDGIANVYDLDSDNDGIPDVVEGYLGIASLSNGQGFLTLTSTNDSNQDGLLDSLNGYTINELINSDTDNTPNYLDLDSDNDGVFDVDEAGFTNTIGSIDYQNGDGDSNGNGFGDGTDSETFQGSAPGYGDGILDVFDSNPGAYGITNQGTGSFYALNSDTDGIPDYMDPTTGSVHDYLGDDILEQLAYTNGRLDDTTDSDGDGIVASRDTNDNLFGSPRNIDGSYSLYFDGRNDYVEDASVDFSTGTGGTIMAFIKKEGTNTQGDNQLIAGKNNFYLRIDSSNKIIGFIGANRLESTTTITDGIWTHVAFTTKANETKLYINGIEEASTASFSGVDNSGDFTIGKAVATDDLYFRGEMDEVRIFNEALTSEEIKRIVYQELDDVNNFNSGKSLPFVISDNTLGGKLIKYYKMDTYTGAILDDKKTSGRDVTGAIMYNFKNIYNQKAPLPYVTKADGDWTNTSTWLYGDEWDIHGKMNDSLDASIVHIQHDVIMDGTYETQGTAGIIVDAGKTLEVPNSKGLYNSFSLELNGTINLIDESQLIQTEGSFITPFSSGKLKRIQYGASSVYEYNYWSSPVGNGANTVLNAQYTVGDIINNVAFSSSGYNGKPTPVTVADYWIWTYPNKPANNINLWEHARSNGTIKAGEGFTMKGTGASSSTQPYQFEGLPFNGDISLTIDKGNEYLVGNPYASALDTHAFIDDNLNLSNGGNNTQNIINGAIYIWDHISTHSHQTKKYEGGYSIITKAGETEAISNDTRINVTNVKGKTAKRYIPVGQGFFVSTINYTHKDLKDVDIDGGNLIFKNSQRAFIKETSPDSEFLKTTDSKSKNNDLKISSDTRAKIRLGFNSPEGYVRELLLGTDENASIAYDLGYEAPLIESNSEDLYWMFSDAKLIIQAIQNFDDVSLKLPLGLKISTEGLATIKIDALENINDQTEVYLFDNHLNTYHDLKSNDFEVYLTPGEYNDRFEISFSTDSTLSNETIEGSHISVSFNNDKDRLVIHNPNSKQIQSVTLFNLLGQSVGDLKISEDSTYNEFNIKQRTGVYIVKLKTTEGAISKKIIVN